MGNNKEVRDTYYDDEGKCVKIFDFCHGDSVNYLFKTLLSIINIWRTVRIYVYEVKKKK